MPNIEYLRDRLESAVTNDRDAVLIKTAELYEVVAFLNALGEEDERQLDSKPEVSGC